MSSVSELEITSKLSEILEIQNHTTPSRKPHPLLIPGVIWKIFEKLSYSDLKSLRLVCSSWQNEASKLLKNKTEIRFVSEAQIEKYLKGIQQNSSCNSFELGATIALKSPTTHAFLTKFGPILDSLKIHNTQWSCSELWVLLSETLPSLKELSIRIFIPKYGHFFPNSNDPIRLFSNLKRLKLNFAIDQPDEYYLNSTFLKEFFLSVPNLETICCPSWPTIILPSTNVSSLVLNVIFSDKNIRFSNLKYLYINASLDDVEMQQLMEKQFPLVELRIELKPDVTSDPLFWFLKSVQTSLKTLTLTFPFGYNSKTFIGFPVLKNLKYLCMHCYEGSISEFTRFFPTLKTLLLNDVNLNDNPYLEKLEIIRTSLSELHIEGRMFGALGQTHKFVKLFSNLRKLKLQNANDEMLRIIFVGFPYLDELILSGRFTDSGVTGIPFEACPEIYSFDNSFLKLHGDKLRMYPFIGHLKELKKINLSSNYLTMLSILLGVSQCQNLCFQRILSSQIATTENDFKGF